MIRPTRTIHSTLPLEIAGTKHPAGTPLHVFEEDAAALIAEGRATDGIPDEPLTPADATRPALPPAADGEPREPGVAALPAQPHAA